MRCLRYTLESGFLYLSRRHGSEEKAKLVCQLKIKPSPPPKCNDTVELLHHIIPLLKLLEEKKWRLLLADRASVFFLLMFHT